jgi:putative tryptophan/tyrosine transport system substrate-binding protein
MKFDQLHRREFITWVGGAAAAWPLAAYAQQPAMPVIGYLYAGSPEATATFVAAFGKGLSEAGYIEGRNVAIEYRWARNDMDRLPELVGDLVRRRVTAIVTPGSIPAARAAKVATESIPIVFSTGGDPVQAGLVSSLNRPGGNVTGILSMNVELMAKRLGLMHELVPGAARFAVLVNPDSLAAESMITDLRAAASAIGQQVEILAARSNADIDAGYASLALKRIDALLVTPDPWFISRRVQLITQAMRHGVPAIFPFRADAEAGALASYGSNTLDEFRQLGIYAGRVLKGEKPADLPVMQATKFEFVINLQTARVLGLEIPPTLLARADEVIE